jgi:hypothetical protein
MSTTCVDLENEVSSYLASNPVPTSSSVNKTSILDKAAVTNESTSFVDTQNRALEAVAIGKGLIAAKNSFSDLSSLNEKLSVLGSSIGSVNDFICNQSDKSNSDDFNFPCSDNTKSNFLTLLGKNVTPMATKAFQNKAGNKQGMQTLTTMLEGLQDDTLSTKKIVDEAAQYPSAGSKISDAQKFAAISKPTDIEAVNKLTENKSFSKIKENVLTANTVKETFLKGSLNRLVSDTPKTCVAEEGGLPDNLKILNGGSTFSQPVGSILPKLPWTDNGSSLVGSGKTSNGEPLLSDTTGYGSGLELTNPLTDSNGFGTSGVCTDTLLDPNCMSSFNDTANSFSTWLSEQISKIGNLIKLCKDYIAKKLDLWFGPESTIGAWVRGVLSNMKTGLSNLKSWLCSSVINSAAATDEFMSGSSTFVSSKVDNVKDWWSSDTSSPVPSGLRTGL